MTALFGAPRPTFFYPRIVYGSPAVTLDFDDPAELVTPAAWDQVRAETTSPSGRRKVLLERTDEFRTIRWQTLDANKAFELAEFFRSHGGQGKQLELYLDRFTGAFLEFDGTLADQQGTLGTFTGTPSYEAATFGRGLRFDAGESMTFPLGPSGQQPTLSGAEGVLVLVVRPSFAPDGLNFHTFLRANGTSFLDLQVTPSNTLSFNISDGVGRRHVDIAVSWVANSEQKMVARWKDAASMELWLNGVKGPAPIGAGNGQFAPLGTSLILGSVAGASEQANGLYDRLDFLTRAFDLNSSVVNLLTDGHFPRWKNYYNKAEVVDFRMQPEKQVPARDLYRAALTFRAGV